METLKAVVRFCVEAIVVLGALACIFQWLAITPRDITLTHWPQWLWLIGAVTLFGASLFMSSKSLYFSIRSTRNLRREAEQWQERYSLAASERRIAETNAARLEHEGMALHKQLDQAGATSDSLRSQIADLQGHKERSEKCEEERARLATELEQYSGPLIVPRGYISDASGRSEIVFVNDGNVEAYNIRTEATFGNFQLELRDISRIAIGADHRCLVMVTGDNVSPDLDWTIGRWQKQFLKITADGVVVDAPPIPLIVYYEDRASRSYRSECEITRDPYSEKGHGVRFRFVRRVPDES